MKKIVFISVIILFLLILFGMPLFLSDKKEKSVLVDSNILYTQEKEGFNNVIEENTYFNETTNNNFDNKVIESVDVTETKSNNETVLEDISNQKKEETKNSENNKTSQSNDHKKVIEDNKKDVEESKTENKTIKAKVNQDSYTELEAGYAYGSQTMELPKEWNY